MLSGLASKQIQRYIYVVDVHFIVHFSYACKLILHLSLLVDEKNKTPATFWSCLQDIQEGLQVNFLYSGTATLKFFIIIFTG